MTFDHSTFSRNRTRLLEHEIAGEFFRGVAEQARGLKLLSDEHFTVDGTLGEAWASLKSFKRKGAGPSQPPGDRGNPTVNFRGVREPFKDPEPYPGKARTVLLYAKTAPAYRQKCAEVAAAGNEGFRLE